MTLLLRNAERYRHRRLDSAHGGAQPHSAERLHRDLAMALGEPSLNHPPLALGIVAVLGSDDVARRLGGQQLVSLLHRAESSVLTLATLDRQLEVYRISGTMLALLLSDTERIEATRIADAVCRRVSRDAPGLRAICGLAHRDQMSTIDPAGALTEDLYQQAWRDLDAQLSVG